MIFILSRPLEAVIPREPPIVQEITSVIREWGAIWKQLYVVSIFNIHNINTLLNIFGICFPLLVFFSLPVFLIHAFDSIRFIFRR